MKKTFVYLGALTTLIAYVNKGTLWTLDYLNHNSSSNSGWAEDSRQSTSYLCEQAPIKTLDTKAMGKFFKATLNENSYTSLSEELFSTVHYYRRRQLTALHLELPGPRPMFFLG